MFEERTIEFLIERDSKCQLLEMRMKQALEYYEKIENKTDEMKQLIKIIKGEN